MTLSRMLVLGLAAPLAGAAADTVTLRPTADANLFEHRPEENSGAAAQLQIGLNNSGNRGRGVYRFDLAAAGIPAGAVVTSAELEVHVAAAGSGAVPTPHGLFRAQLPWGEGGVSWCASDAGAYWTIPGGGAGSDYHATASAVAELDGAGAYRFGPAAGLVADVQRWLDGTAANRGWLLVSENESTPGNSRRVGAREAGDAAPALTIEYTPFRVTAVGRAGTGRTSIVWTGGTPPFGIETSDGGAVWQAVPGVVVDGREATVATPAGGGLLRVRDRVASPAPGARYRVDFVATWSAATHPAGFPNNAHFSPLVGVTHDGGVSFWEPGGFATPGIERMAERGSTSVLVAEFAAAESDGTADTVLLGSGTGSPGGASLEFDVAASHPRVTLVTMIAPSPDWFVGVSGLDLSAGGRWADTVTVALQPYDAGTDSGAGHTSPDADTDPAEPVARIAGAPFDDGGKLRPLGAFTFTRID